MYKFTLNDLKTGYVVKFKNKRHGLVLIENGCAFGVGQIVHEWEDMASPIIHYNSKMENTVNRNLDIIKVFKPNRWPNISDLGCDCKKENLVWERQEPRKMTLEQISEALGYEVEIVDG